MDGSWSPPPLPYLIYLFFKQKLFGFHRSGRHSNAKTQPDLINTIFKKISFFSLFHLLRLLTSGWGEKVVGRRTTTNVRKQKGKRKKKTVHSNCVCVLAAVCHRRRADVGQDRIIKHSQPVKMTRQRNDATTSATIVTRPRW